MDRDSGYVHDILQSVRLVEIYMERISLEDFLRNTQLQDSVARRIEIIGEAAQRVSPQFREKHPQIPWSEMIGMRNRMIHDYDDMMNGLGP